MRKVAFFVLFLALAGMHSVLAQDQWAIVNVSDCFMREEPRYGSECVSQSRMGTLVQVLERKGYWVRIKTPEPYEGWVNELSLAPTRELSSEEQKATGLYGATLKPMSREEAEEYLRAPKAIITQSSINVTSDGSLVSDKTVCTLQRGNIVRLIPDDGPIKQAFPQILLPDGRTGHVYYRHIRHEFRRWAEDEAAEADSTKVNDMVRLAKSYCGAPYLWGGMSPGHFDCSGLTGFCYFMNGILLPRDASQQVKCGVEVPFEDMQAGDLVFFGNTSVGHVALCIGEHKIIHASQLVRINSLIPGEPDYYGRNILHIRRIVGHIGEGEGGFRPIYTKDSPAYFPLISQP